MCEIWTGPLACLWTELKVISVGCLMPSLYLMTRLQSVEGNRVQVLTFTPLFIARCFLTDVSGTLLAQRRSLALTTPQVQRKQPIKMCSQSVFVLCLLADLWSREVAAFRVCPCLTVTWRSWMETPCAFLDSGRWRPWSEAGEFRPPVLSLSSPCATSTLTPSYPHCRV